MSDYDDNLYLWNYFRSDTAWDWCWSCGRGERDKPPNWHAEWFPHRAHIVHNPRKKDRRVAILLCPICHGLSHGERYPGHDLPPLTVANMLYLKQIFDPEYFDREFCQQNTIGVLPLPKECHVRYNTAYEQRRGMRPNEGENG